MAQDNLDRVQRLNNHNISSDYPTHFYHLHHFYHKHFFISWALTILATVIIIYGEIFCLNGFSIQNHQGRMPQTATRTVTHNTNQPNTRTNHLSKNSRITYLNNKMKGIELPDRKRTYLINIYKKQNSSLQKHIYNIVQHYDHDIPTNTLKRHLLKYYLQKYNI